MASKEENVPPHGAMSFQTWTLMHVALSQQPPILPKVSHEGDTSNFDVYPEDDWKKDPPVPQKDLEIFENF